MKADAVELLISLIQNECVNDGSEDSGEEHRSVATLQSFLGAEGEVFEPHPGRQSVVYRVRGSAEGAPALALLTHLDVVPAGDHIDQRLCQRAAAGSPDERFGKGPSFWS